MISTGIQTANSISIEPLLAERSLNFSANFLKQLAAGPSCFLINRHTVVEVYFREVSDVEPFCFPPPVKCHFSKPVHYALLITKIHERILAWIG